MDRNTVKVYVTNIENQGFDTVNRETRIRHKVSFRLEWPVRALVLEHHVSTYANQENAVERTYPSRPNSLK